MKIGRFILNLILLVILIQMGTINSLSAGDTGNMDPQRDTIIYLSFSGKIIDAETKQPVAFASIYKIGTNIGTVSNTEGEFVFKITGSSKDGQIGVSFIGYKDFSVAISTLKPLDNVFELTPSPILLQEVVIRTKDPIDLLNSAMSKISENYTRSPMMLTSFYRETVKQNRNYVAVSEAILDVYKSSYVNDLDFDRVKVFKGRKSLDVKKMDTVLVKLQGGPTTSFLMDVVKNPAVLMDKEFMEYYTYEFAGMIEIDDRLTYVIKFDQKSNVDYPLFTGKIYLDEKNLAFVSIEFQLSEKGIDKAANELVKKRPANMKIDITGSKYLVNYRELEGKWYLNHVRSELMFKCKWDKKLFKSNYVTTLEMAVTDRSIENVDKYKIRESLKATDIFADKAEVFQQDNDFWGEYNTIKPDESIEAAIARLNKKVIRANKIGEE